MYHDNNYNMILFSPNQSWQIRYIFLDLDECTVYNGGCIDACVNSVGSFKCQCSGEGYTLANDKKTCIDTDECLSDLHNCTVAQRCINTLGSHICMSMDNLPSSAGIYSQMLLAF